MNRWVWAMASAVLAMGFASCAEDGAGGTDVSSTAGANDVVSLDGTGNGGCPAGTKPKYDPNTGQLDSCVKDTSADVVGGPDVKFDATANDSGGGSDIGTPTDDAIAAPACKPTMTSEEKWFNCLPTPVNAGAKLHGESCAADADCLYGVCMFGLPLAGYDKAIGVCTKNCGFSLGSSKNIACDAEDPSGNKFKCVMEKTQKIGNTMRDLAKQDLFKSCARTCANDNDCKAYNPDLPTCTKVSTAQLSTPAVGVCVRLPK